MSGILSTLPLLIPLLGIILLTLTRHHQRLTLRLSLFLNFCLLAASLQLAITLFKSGAVSIQMGNWKAPFGITFVADSLSVIMLTVSGLLAFVTALYQLGDRPEEHRSEFTPALTQGLLLGINGAFLTGDLFNLFVWFEVMLMASFVLSSLGSHRSLREGAIKYLFLNFISSALFLIALGLLYGQIGTLNMADIAQKARGLDLLAPLAPSAILLMIAFSIKTALFPLFSWLPASYPTFSDGLGALFGGLLTKVGVYVFYRVFGMILPLDALGLRDLLLWISVLTMIIGVLGAASHYEMRKILSVHIISQVGYMTLALAFESPIALAAGILYMLHNMIVKTNLFLICGTVRQTYGTAELKLLGNGYARFPLLALFFALAGFSLGGIPPLSGFFAKFTLIRAGFAQGEYLATALAMLVGILTLFSMTKIWAEAFWKKVPEASQNPAPHQPSCYHLVAIAILTLAMLSFTLFPGTLWNFCERAVEFIHESRHYEKVVAPQPF
jgi:multicomponent Na+:H+ antiporter subunit D